MNLLAHAEDVGRHNALDKAIGKTFLENTLGRAVVVVLSSRVSYELVQRVARSKIPFVLSVSRPTALAVEVADRFNITLACLSRYDGLMIFCNKGRWDLEKSTAETNSLNPS